MKLFLLLCLVAIVSAKPTDSEPPKDETLPESDVISENKEVIGVLDVRPKDGTPLIDPGFARIPLVTTPPPSNNSEPFELVGCVDLTRPT
ncbi:unnamed protein product [Arctia plantaginis]|uniref:Uncharacterized protein n=1 Tax=Arctia plantaginis TaxID=874455 RepID=A0A8S1AMN6_ARCPL|nr:unnamed protein product [Arctia plantaginis]